VSGGVSRRTIGIIEVLASGLCFGFLGLFGKRALEKGLTPFEFLAFRYLFAALMMAIIVSVKNRRLSALWIGRKNALLSLALGVLGYAVFSSFYFLALERISASMTVILLYTYPVLVSAGGAVFFKERIPRSRLPAVPMAFLGLVALVWMDLRVGQPTGLFFGLLAAVFYSVYILLSSHWMKGGDPMASTFWIQLGAGATLFVISLLSVERTTQVISQAWLEIVLIAFVCSVLAMWLFLSGLLKVKNWEASLLSMAEPITGVAVGVLILGDRLSSLQWTGAGLVLAALALVSIPERRAGVANQ
jgi:drug/metabolite transporter (DMT)-like permease